MIFSLTEDQAMVREMVRKFAADVVLPQAHAWETAGALPAQIFGQLLELGILNATTSADEGGSELDAVSFALVLEELARADASVALSVGSHDAALSLADARRADIVAAGELLSVACNGLTTTCNHAQRVATTEGVFDASGQVEAFETLGVRACAVGRIDVSGAPPACWPTWVAAVAVGVARGALEDAAAYAQERQQFGKPIAAYQAIQFKLAEMATAVDAARLLVLHAAGDDGDSDAAMRFAVDAALHVTDEAVQIHGGYGYVREFPVERYYRDARCLLMWATT